MWNVVTVESLYSAMCECQALHPDENDSASGGCHFIMLLFHMTCSFVILLRL